MMRRPSLATAIAALAAGVVLGAHAGPPFPIISGHVAGPYVIALWTDPDTTDDGSAGGQFWVRLQRGGQGGTVPAGTRATVTVKPTDGTSPERTQHAEPVSGDVSNQFAGLVLDRETRYAVRVAIDGPLGPAEAEAWVDATYDLRPAPYLLVLYLAPFVLVGALWARLLARRRKNWPRPRSAN